MGYQLSFAHRTSYDMALPGITVDVTLSLADYSVTFLPNWIRGRRIVSLPAITANS